MLPSPTYKSVTRSRKRYARDTRLVLAIVVLAVWLACEWALAGTQLFLRRKSDCAPEELVVTTIKQMAGLGGMQ